MKKVCVRDVKTETAEWFYYTLPHTLTLILTLTLKLYSGCQQIYANTATQNLVEIIHIIKLFWLSNNWVTGLPVSWKRSKDWTEIWGMSQIMCWDHEFQLYI